MLDPVTTIGLFLVQVLHGNVACRRLRHLSGLTFTVEAYCKARRRLPVDVFGDLAASLIAKARDALNDNTNNFSENFRGRIWLIDGSSASMPDTPALQRAFGQPGSQREVTLVTTLLDPGTYPKAELAALYQQRWQVETNLRHLKQTMGMHVLRCQTVDGVLKELWMYLLAYNLVRLAMLEAARRQGVEPNRISFADALDCLRDRWWNASKPALALVVNPLRPGRVEPRVIKRRRDVYTVMTKPRDALRQALGLSAVRA